VPRVAGRADPGAAVMKALCDDCTDRRRPPNRRRNSEVPITLCRAGAATHAAKDGGAMMAALRSIWAPVGPEFQMAQGDWRETKTAPQPVCVAVGSEYLMVAGNGVSS
jgi:hypothetical protein